MICKNCSFDNQPEATVCAKCGSSLTDDTEIAENQVPEEVSDEIVTEDINAGSEEEAPVAEDAEDAYATADSEESTDETALFKANVEEIDSSDIQPTTLDKEEATLKSSKRTVVAAFSGLIALVILGACLFIVYSGIFAPKYDIPNDRIKNPISYVKDDTLYTKPLTGKTTAVSGTLTAGEEKEGASYQSSQILQSVDGKTTYFLEELDPQTSAGTLYVSYDNKNKTQIATGVATNYVISRDGKAVMYLQNPDPQTYSGQLYVYKKGGQPVKLSDNASSGNYMFSDNSKTVTYLENYSQETYSGDLYFSNLSGKSVNVDSGVAAIAKISGKNEITYYKDYDPEAGVVNFIYWKSGKTPLVAASGISPNYVLTTPFSTKAAYVKNDEEKYDFYLSRPGSDKPIEIMKDIMGFFTWDVQNENFLLAKPNADTPETPDAYLKKGTSAPIYVAGGMQSQRSASASLDFSRVTYITNVDPSTGAGTLYQKRFMFGKAVSEKEIAQNVASFTTTRDGKTIAYLTDMDQQTQSASLSIYKNGKSTFISDGIFQGNFKVSENGKSVIYLANFDSTTYSGSLFAKKLTGSGKITQIDSNVYAMFYSRSDKNAIYFKNFDMTKNAGDLYLWKGSKTPEQVDSNVSAIMFENTK